MLQKRVPIVPQGVIGKTADMLMQPVMYWLQGNWDELPQQTHFWNNQKFSVGELDWLDDAKMVVVPGDPLAEARRKWGLIPTFHMPRFGGWKQYVVLGRTSGTAKWHVGWMTDDVHGVSRVSLTTSVRVLRGPGECRFFGINRHGRQLPLEIIDSGTLGDQKWGHLPLL